MLGGLLALVILFTPLASLQATELAWLRWPGQESRSISSKRSPKSRLQEVPPPDAVQDIQKRLEKRHPTLRLVSPADEALLTTDHIHLIVQVEDWPLLNRPDIDTPDSAEPDINKANQEIGPHVAVQIDDRPPVLVRSLDDGNVHLDVEDLQPGSHRFSAWAAYPWGEAVKRPGAAINWRLHLWDKLTGAQPGRHDPWLVPIAPTAWHRGDPLLLDWLIWNAPLQNLRADDQRWTLRLSVNGQSIRLNQQESIWLKGATDSDQLTVQMELLDALGEPITPAFNNRLLHLPATPGDRPTWLKGSLSDNALAHLTGEPLNKASTPTGDGAEVVDSDQSQIDVATTLDADPSDRDTSDKDASDEDAPGLAASDAAWNDTAVASDSDTAISEEEISSSSVLPDKDPQGVLVPPDPAIDQGIDQNHASETDPRTAAANPNMDQNEEPQAEPSPTSMNEPGSSLGRSEEELREPS